MSFYFNKYLKYKTKYLKNKNIPYKVQYGGDLQEFLYGFTQIPNAGQHNCGIFIRDNLIIKCSNGLNDTKTQEAMKINQTAIIFPQIYDIYKDEVNKKHYVKMEKLDGDITNLFYEEIPNRVLNDMEFDDAIKIDIMKIFDAKIPKIVGGIHLITHIYYDRGTNNFGTYFLESLQRINDYFKEINPNITFLMYDNFMNIVLATIKKYYISITTAMTNLLMTLFNMGKTYFDNKFDNYGYKLVDAQMDEYTVPFYDKFIRIYILDWESGLSNVTEYSYKHMMDAIDDRYSLYTVHGQYYMKNFNQSIILKDYFGTPLTDIEQQNIKSLLGVSDELYNILMKDYVFDPRTIE